MAPSAVSLIAPPHDGTQRAALDHACAIAISHHDGLNDAGRYLLARATRVLDQDALPSLEPSPPGMLPASTATSSAPATGGECGW